MPRIVLIAGLLLAGTGFADRVHAVECKCPVLSTQEHRDAATYVFNGEVWDVEQDHTAHKRVITLDVDDSFKGTPPSRLELRDAEDGTDCETDFHEGESYLVYVRWLWGTMLTSRCWGTKKLQEAGQDAGTLGASANLKEKYYKKMRELCMGRRDTPCCLSSVKAMGVGGYLPQPENGCPDEMIPDRLRCEGSHVWCVPATELRRHNR